MSAEACAAALANADVPKRAEALDAAFPGCACEPWALTALGGDGVANHELIARVLTSPDSYDEPTETIMTQKLTQIYAMGMSVIRQGASNEEIVSTAEDLLTSAAEQRKLIGAIIMTAAQLRAYVNEADLARWFGVYATDDRGKAHHGDIFGTKVSKGQQQKRRYKLAVDMLPLIVKAETPERLVAALREAGI